MHAQCVPDTFSSSSCRAWERGYIQPSPIPISQSYNAKAQTTALAVHIQQVLLHPESQLEKLFGRPMS